MIERMRRYRIGSNKEGSSLVTVVIGVLFLAAIGLIVLTVSSKYLVAVNVDHNSSDNFYQTEGILEELKTGLLEYAGEAAESAYKEVMESYTSTDKADATMQDAFAKKYITNIATKLRGTAYVWKDEDVGNTDLYVEKKEKNGASIYVIGELTKYPETVKTTTPNMRFVINQDSEGNYSLTLKDVVIDYTDETDYRSTIQTDICLGVPDYNFEGDSTLNEIKDYIVISDDQLKDDNATGLEFRGNIYTGNTDAGIVLRGQCTDGQKTAVFYSPTIISRGSLDQYSGSRVTLAGDNGGACDLWLQNIRLKPSVSGTGKVKVQPNTPADTTLELNANAYIANDLDIEANNTEVTLSGKYYGYSYNEENTDTTGSARSDYSSAILINGLNTTLKSKNLEKLILAGRTFVSRGGESVSDIQMGESIAVKSNQLAYLLPDVYLKAGHNPLTESEEESKVGTVDEVRLKESELYNKYLNDTTPYTKNYSNTGGYVFYYLNFKNEKSANDYFADYYNGETKDEEAEEEEDQTISNKDEIEKRGQAYTSTVCYEDANIKFSPEFFLVAGNVIHNYDATDGSGFQTANYYDDSGAPDTGLLENGKTMGRNYVGYQLTLQSSGSTGSMRLAEDADKLVKDTIIDFDKLSEIVPQEKKWLDEESGYSIYTSSEDTCVIDSSFTAGLVIAKGDVTVEHDFTGLIIAGGKVTMTTSNVKLKSDQIMIGKLLAYAKKDASLSQIFYAFNGKSVEKNANLSDCISYDNWQKNEPIATAAPTADEEGVVTE